MNLIQTFFISREIHHPWTYHDEQFNIYYQDCRRWISIIQELKLKKLNYVYTMWNLLKQYSFLPFRVWIIMDNSLICKAIQKLRSLRIENSFGLFFLVFSLITYGLFVREMWILSNFWVNFINIHAFDWTTI